MMLTKAERTAIRNAVEAHWWEKSPGGKIPSEVTDIRALLDHIDALEGALRGVLDVTASLHEYAGIGPPSHRDDCRFCAARRLVEES